MFANGKNVKSQAFKRRYTIHPTPSLIADYIIQINQFPPERFQIPQNLVSNWCSIRCLKDNVWKKYLRSKIDCKHIPNRICNY